MSVPSQTLVIGGGVVGAGCAYYLSKAGCEVTLIDRGEFGKACSHGNCGYISPSHVLPLSQPGVVWKSLKSMMSKDSPFYIKPRFSPTLWKWLWNFWRGCNVKDMTASGQALAAILKSSRALYDDLLRDEQLDCEWEDKGFFFVHQSQQSFDHFAAINNYTQKEFGVSGRPVPEAELLQMEPALKPGIAGAYLFDIDAHLRSDKLMSAWKENLTKRGVKIVENCEFKSLVVENGRAVGAETSQGRLTASAFVVATGAWTPLIQTELGCRVPIQPGKGYSITMPRPKICPIYPMIFEEHRVGITPFKSGYRIGSTMEFGGYDTNLSRHRLDILKRGAAIYLREPFAEPIQEEWYGWRPMTYDSKPIIGFAPRAKNVAIAAGHSMLGLTLSPATGKLVTELLSGEQPHLDLQPFSPLRF